MSAECPSNTMRALQELRGRNRFSGVLPVQFWHSHVNARCHQIYGASQSKDFLFKVPIHRRLSSSQRQPVKNPLVEGFSAISARGFKLLCNPVPYLHRSTHTISFNNALGRNMQRLPAINFQRNSFSSADGRLIWLASRSPAQNQPDVH